MLGVRSSEKRHTASAPIDDPIKKTGAPGHFDSQNGTRTSSACCSASEMTSEKLWMAKRGVLGSEFP